MHRITAIVLIVLGVLYAYTALQVLGSASRGKEKGPLPALQETHNKGMGCRTPSPGERSRFETSARIFGGTLFWRDFSGAPFFSPKSCKLYEISAYSNHVGSTGKSEGAAGYGITASGRPTKEGRTIATDTLVIPFGSILWVEGIGIRVAEDTGGAIEGNKLDVYMEKEEDCFKFGRQNRAVVVLYKAER